MHPLQEFGRKNTRGVAKRRPAKHGVSARELEYYLQGILQPAHATLSGGAGGLNSVEELGGAGSISSADLLRCGSTHRSTPWARSAFGRQAGERDVAGALAARTARSVAARHGQRHVRGLKCVIMGRGSIASDGRSTNVWRMKPDHAIAHCHLIFETHIHADLVSGSRELCARLESAKIYSSGEGGAEYGFGPEK
mgnify:CR=1 FL=1